jgi:hypothetical protein
MVLFPVATSGRTRAGQSDNACGFTREILAGAMAPLERKVLPIKTPKTLVSLSVPPVPVRLSPEERHLGDLE